MIVSSAQPARYKCIADNSTWTKANESKVGVLPTITIEFYSLILFAAAIEMTLCELATANHSPPLECVSLTVDTELAEDNYKPRLLNSCVEYVDEFHAAYMRLVVPDNAP